ncbi:MAG: AsnC family transcriptional regulator [Nitrososphaeria archaeon]|nr:AsnC family transcriptional regulator [Nitrososphaeria archaeon]NIQ32591.1 AsnC family transcriptional regulator [Nitrososphaeria archaeon]
MSVKIDEIDKKILNELQEDARASFRSIGEKIGVSEATVFIRIKKMRQRGIIKCFRADISPEKIGKGLKAFVLIKATPKRYPEALDNLKDIENVYEIYDVTGVYYAILKIRTRDHDELARTLDRIGSIEGISSTETSVVLRTIKEESKINI